MNENELASKSFDLIKSDLRLDEQFNAEVAHPWSALHTYLTKIVSYMMDHDFQGLLNALYRIDVHEDKVKEILGISSTKEIAKNLASAIIEREKQKVRTRMQYPRA